MKHTRYRAPRAGNPIAPKWLGETDQGHVLQGGPMTGRFLAVRYAGPMTLPMTIDGCTGYYDGLGVWVQTGYTPPERWAWRAMWNAPRDATWIEVRMPSGTLKRVHWAQGGGEDQPAFGPGWFESVGTGSSRWFREITEKPEAWRPC